MAEPSWLIPTLRAPDCNVERCREALVAHGMTRIEDASPELFDELTAGLATRIEKHQGPRFGTREDVDSITTSTDLGNYSIPWHNERGYAPKPPDVVFFYCLEPGANGSGITLVVDGERIVDELPIEKQAELRGVQICFRGSTFKTAAEIPDRVAEWERLGGRSRQADNGLVELEIQTGVVTRSAFSGKDAFCNYLLAALGGYGGPTQPVVFAADDQPLRRPLVMSSFRRADECAVPIKWRPRDLVVVDNRRCMHARPWFRDEGRKILFRMGHLS
jgi:hypothetical protein